MAESIGLALGFVGLIGMFSVYVDVSETVRSYRDCDLELWGAVAKFESNKVLFERWNRILSSSFSSVPVRDIQLVVSAIQAISIDTEKRLDGLLPARTVSRDMLLGPNNTTDLEFQLPKPPPYPSILAKLRWSLGDKSRITTRVQAFAEHVDMLQRLVPFYNSVPSYHPTLLWKDQFVWLTDIRGIRWQLHIGLCGFVGGFILYLMSSLKDREPMDPHIKSRLLNGEFWIFPDEENEVDLHPGDRRTTRPVILADTWEMNVRPGRKFKMVMPDEGGVESVPQAVGLETLHSTWEAIVKPILPDILRLSGWA